MKRFVLWGWLGGIAWSLSGETTEAFRREVAIHVSRAEQAGKKRPRRYGGMAVLHSEAPKRQRLPAILDFQEQLRRAGIALLFLPVPAKAVIYPEEISNTAPSVPSR